MTTIQITVLAYGEIRKYLKKSNNTIEMIPESSIKDLFKLLKKPRDEIWMTSVNGILVNEEKKLKDGDEVKIFEPVGGG